MPSPTRPSLVRAIRQRQEQGLFPVISEIKVRSEKEGDLLVGRDPFSLVREMATCPVAGISVVTEPHYFGGSEELLRRVTQSVSLPVLRKDFIDSPSQIEQSARDGAAAVLLIASLLEDGQIAELVDAARIHGLESLVEVHTMSDMERVRRLEFDLLGINNRDIQVLEVDDTDVECTERLARYHDRTKPLISESSIASTDDVLRAGRAGADAVLVGTAVMRASNIPSLLKSMISVGWPV
jgi:indole-3-glycerol phosphate synthase